MMNSQLLVLKFFKRRMFENIYFAHFLFQNTVPYSSFHNLYAKLLDLLPPLQKLLGVLSISLHYFLVLFTYFLFSFYFYLLYIFILLAIYFSNSQLFQLSLRQFIRQAIVIIYCYFSFISPFIWFLNVGAKKKNNNCQQTPQRPAFLLQTNQPFRNNVFAKVLAIKIISQLKTQSKNKTRNTQTTTQRYHRN